MTARPTLSTVEEMSFRCTVPNFGELPKMLFRSP
jgi:hypothetical protein